MTGAGLVIVGGSYAGLQIAAAARARGYAEPIRLISDEPHLPYHRPPLSKAFITGQTAPSSLTQRAEAFYRESAIEPLLETRVTAIDRAAKRIETGDGRWLAFDRLGLALGARARALPVAGAGLDGVVSLRSLADAVALRGRLSEAADIVVIGGGYIGLELAAALAGLGKRITLIEAQPRLLARAVAPPLSEFVAAFHRARGVNLMLGVTTQAIEGTQGRVRSVLCSDGARHPADLVIAAVGAAPNIALAEACGLACDDGILVDRLARTRDPDIVAAGDCTRHPSAYAGGPLRLESVQNALDQAKVAGATIAGAATPYDAVPWFWSDQADLKLQIVGLSRGYDAYALRGSLEAAKFSLFYFRAGALIAIDSVNRPADHMLGRKLLATAVRVTPEQAGDAGFDLRTLLDG